MKQNTRQVLATAARSALDPQGQGGQGAKFPMSLEPLEDRRLMTAVPSATGGPITLSSNGVLTLTGNPTAGNQLRVDLGGSGKNQIVQADVNGTFQSFPATTVKQIRITGGSGNDYVYVDPRVGTPTSIVTGDGNDTIRTGHGHATVRAGDGDDAIYTHGSDNAVYAGAGKNRVVGDRVTDAAGNEVRTGGLANTYLYSRTRATATKATTAKATASTAATKATTAPTSTMQSATPTTTQTTTTKAATPTATPVATSVATPVATKTTTASPVATSPVAKPVSQVVSPATTAVVQPAVEVAGGTAALDMAALTAPVNPGGVTADGKPVAVLDIMPGIRQTGLVLNVDGMNSKVGTGNCVTTEYAWDFGDASGTHDTMTGYNAGHVYDKPGTYTVTLTVTNQDGQASVAKGQVTIAASTRQQIFVDSVNGSDSNTGLSTSAPLKTAAAAFAKLGANTEVLLKAGETFSLEAGISINSANVLIGKYGTGADPTIMRAAGFAGQAFQTFNDADGVTIQNITFDSPNAVSTSAAANKTGVAGIYLRGSNLTVRNCTFLNIDDAVNSAGNPGGYLVEDNAAPLVNGLRGYMVWAQGSRGTIIGNTVANSTREHCIRLVDASQVTVEDNTLTNLNRTADGDVSDISKGCIEMQQGQYGWIAGNHVTDGDIRVGPRGATGIYGETATSSTDNCVVQDNQLTDTFIFVQPGAHNAMIQNNVIVENTPGEVAMTINGTDEDGRTAENIVIRNNTVTQAGTSGNFLRVNGYCSGVSLYDNLYVAPQLQVLNNWACAVYVSQPSLSCFTKIAHNVWPASTVATGKWGGGGAEYIGTDGVTAADWVSASQWDAEPEVSGDVLKNVTTADLAAGTYQLAATASATGQAAGATLARAA